MLEGIGLAIVGTFLVLVFLGSVVGILSNSTQQRDPKIARVAGLVSLFFVVATAYFVFQ